MSRPYRLAFLTSHPIQYQAPLFRALAQRPEIDLTVLFCSDQGARAYYDPGFGASFAWDIPLLEGYRSVFLPNLNRRGGPGRFFGLVNPSIVIELRRGHFDALVVHGWAYLTNWLAFAAASVLGIPLMIRGETNGLREPTGWRRRLKRLLLGALFRRTAACLAIGSLNRRFYCDYGVAADRLFFTPYAVDTAFFHKMAKTAAPRETLRAERGVSPETTVFLFCGKLIPVKRPLDVVSAFQRLGAHGRAVLMYAGDGPMRMDVERAADTLDVRILGFRNQTELPHDYMVADVLVLPSEFEPWGLVVNEALAFGLSIIASDQVGAAPDLVKPEAGGQIIPIGDIDALALAMRRCIETPVRHARVEAKRLVDTWTIGRSVDGIVDALSATVGHRQRTA